MAASAQKQHEMDKRRMVVAELYLRGWTQRMIAEHEDVDMSVATVNRDLSTIRERWIESSLIDFDEAIARQLARLERMEDELWAAWYASVEDEVKEKKKRKEVMASTDEFQQDEDGNLTRTKRAGQKKPTEMEMERTTKTRYGDMSIMRQLQGVWDRRTMLLGLDEYDRTADADRLHPLVEAIESTAEDMDADRFEDEDIR